jgi:DNA invertase Pin-like site-specific DNA recombinase
MITNDRISADHLRRKAYLYVRQSTIYQTEQNTESLERQYGFREQARSLGWHPDPIVTLDEDLGQSGGEGAHRTGFQRLVADVGLGRVGIVLSLEVSRLARNSSDWHQLLQLCAVTDTLILDEDGLYDPNQFNDRLLLGLRGTMSEAELHFLRARLQGGKLNKARRGELRTSLPAGLTYDEEGRIGLDPDRQVQLSIRTVFESFERLRTAWQVVRQLRQDHIRLPVRLRTGPQAGDNIWVDATLSRVLHILKNPRYAGMYFYGRTRQRPGTPSQTLPTDLWKVMIPNAHPGPAGLDRYLVRRKRETSSTDHVFISLRGRLLSRQAIQPTFRQLLKKIGLDSESGGRRPLEAGEDGLCGEQCRRCSAHLRRLHTG